MAKAPQAIENLSLFRVRITASRHFDSADCSARRSSDSDDSLSGWQPGIGQPPGGNGPKGGGGGPYWRWQGFQPGLWYPGMGGSVPFGQGGLSVIGGMFDFGGTSDSGTIFAQPLPGGAFVPFSWGNEPGGNVGAGEIINAFTEGGHNPRDL